MALRRLADHYNRRLRQLHSQFPSAGFEPWTDAEIDHNVGDALNAGPPTGRKPGWLLDEESGPPAAPMAWDNPRKLADGFAAGTTVRFVKDLAYRYTGSRYAIVSDQAMRGAMRTHVEGQALGHYHERLGRWEQQNGADLRRLEGELAKLQAPSAVTAGQAVDPACSRAHGKNSSRRSTSCAGPGRRRCRRSAASWWAGGRSHRRGPRSGGPTAAWSAAGLASDPTTA